MKYPRVEYKKKKNAQKSWDEVFDFFKIPIEYRDDLLNEILNNKQSERILFHINRFIKLVPFGVKVDDYLISRCCTISSILESMDSPIVPVFNGGGVDLEEWKVLNSPIEYWDRDKIIRECQLVYKLVDVEFKGKRKYLKKDIYNMLGDLLSLGRIYSFDMYGDKGVFKYSKKGEENSYFDKGNEVKVHKVMFPKPLKRVYDDDYVVEMVSDD